MTRGFVTIATGKENYYRIAAALLRSYRHFSQRPEPFAILCETTNRYTDLFDLAVVLPDPRRSYVDKLSLPEHLPFDENIFIDADCLAYRDLNDFWTVFEGADDFSAFGRNYPLDYRYGWFRLEDTGIWRDHVTYVPDFIGGVYFLRRTDALQEFYRIARRIESTYGDYTFRQFQKVADEPVFALAMSVCGFRTMDKKSPDVCFFPHTTYFESDIAAGTAEYEDRYTPERGRISRPYMVHWGSGNTRRMPYLLERYRLDRVLCGKPAGKAALKAAKVRLGVKAVVEDTWIREQRKLRKLVKRIKRKLRKILAPVCRKG